MFNNIIELIKLLANDSTNPEINFNIASEYEKIGQSASAMSFYLRAAEYGEDTHRDITYSSLLKVGICLDEQGSRFWSVSNSFLQAVQYEPKKPEAYLLLSKFYEKTANWQEAYTFAELGLQYSDDYPLLFQKAVAGWNIGRADESKAIFEKLNNLENVEEPYKTLITNNYNSLSKID
jgi:tetratricopeptide (TPR) repeat protein